MIRNKKYSRSKHKNLLRSSSVKIQKRIIRAILIMGAVALLIIFFFGDHGLYQLYTLKTERDQIQKQINYLREQKIALEGEKNKLKTDYKYIEKLAREKYRMAKKGEKVFKVIEEKKLN